jgi:hypothetical protein
MKCPHCFHNMECRSEQHHIGYGGVRMDLHCFNPGCKRTHAHMGVLAYPNKKWICNSYHFVYQHKGRDLYLVGEPNEIDTIWLPGDTNDSTKSSLYGEDNWKIKHTLIRKSYNSLPMIETAFIPISTDNDMHEDAQRVFDRLIKLVIFT